MTKFKAALIHLSLSVILIGILALIVVYRWYPFPLYKITGVIEPAKLLVLVDVIIGPLLTFVVYKKYKKYLKLDLSIIAVLQIAALSYGVHTIYQGRANLIVFNKGELHYLLEKYAQNEDLQYQELQPGFFSAPKMAQVFKKSAFDLYGSYGQIKPMTDPHIMDAKVMTAANMKAKFTGKINQIDAIINGHENDEIVFIFLEKDMGKYYVAFSMKYNRIVDYLEF
jgi:hypothetical protein